ncbi:MAG: hypothetical protein HYY18_09340 [Planctomycetes bacterium]|nr:hypothetical protein [Planctomycetota bacterium]
MRNGRFLALVRLTAAAAYLAALTATAGVPLCTAADGHSAYEIGGDECCGELHAQAPATVSGCCDGCGAGESVAAAPDCGGCSDVLAPLPGGIPSTDAAVAAGIELPATGVENGSTPGGAALAPPAPAASPPPPPAVLRC